MFKSVVWIPRWSASQVEVVQARLDERQRRGELKVNEKGEVLDRESKHLLHHRTNYLRLVTADEQERKAMFDNEQKYRQIALTNYHRCSLRSQGSFQCSSPTFCFALKALSQFGMVSSICTERTSC